MSAAAKHRIATLLPQARSLPADRSRAEAQDLLIIAVPDDALAGVVAGLATTSARCAPARWSPTPPAPTDCPFSNPPAPWGARPIALHPAMTFTGTPPTGPAGRRDLVRGDRPRRTG